MVQSSLRRGRCKPDFFPYSNSCAAFNKNSTDTFQISHGWKAGEDLYLTQNVSEGSFLGRGRSKSPALKAGAHTPSRGNETSPLPWWSASASSSQFLPIRWLLAQKEPKDGEVIALKGATQRSSGKGSDKGCLSSLDKLFMHALRCELNSSYPYQCFFGPPRRWGEQ